MALKMFEQVKAPFPLAKVKNVIAVAAGKGGVGKSTVAVNLALALKKAGYSVGVMDTDIYGPSIRKMLPEDEMPSQKGETLFPAICQGIRMISMAYFRKQGEAAAVRAPIANGLVIQFIKNVEWGELDYLFIDFPPGTGDIQLTLSQQANLSGAILVTTPQEVALMDVRKAAHLFHQVNVPIVGVVENMSYYQPEGCEKVFLFGKGGGGRLAMENGIPFLGEVPIDPEICHCGDVGRSLFADEKMETSGAKAFTEIAQAFVAHLGTMKRQSVEGFKAFELVWKEMMT